MNIEQKYKIKGGGKMIFQIIFFNEIKKKKLLRFTKLKIF